MGNDGYGILVQGGSNNRVLGNLVSGNGLGGIAVVGDTADNNQLVRNRVGVQLAGGLPLPNQGNGILITDGDANALEQNLVSGNLLAGVMVNGTATTKHIDRKQDRYRLGKAGSPFPTWAMESLSVRLETKSVATFPCIAT